MQPSVQPTSYPTGLPSTQPTVKPSMQPSRQPSMQPSRQPSSQPSRQPTSQPSGIYGYYESLMLLYLSDLIGYFTPYSGQPSMVPSTVPSSIPTSVPTQVPVSSYPTYEGESKWPTAIPTSAPSLNLDTFPSEDLYIKFENLKSEVDKNTSNLNFANFFFKSENIDGVCEEWQEFRESGLNLPISNIIYPSISMYMGYFDLKNANFNYNGRYLTATCSDRIINNAIINSFTKGKNLDIICNDNLWRVFTCKDMSVICINCEKGCTSCPGSSFLLSPCKTLCRSQLASYSIMSVVAARGAVFPNIAPLKVFSTPEKFNVQIAFNLTGIVYCAAFLSPYMMVSASAIKQSGHTLSILKHSVNNTNQLYNITIDGLEPSTLYDIFCYSEFLSGEGMDAAAIFSTKVTMSTSCCSYVKLTTPIKFLPVYGPTSISTLPLLQFKLYGRPRSDAIIQMSSYSCPNSNNGQGTVNPSFAPLQFLFDEYSVYRQGTFRIKATTIGCYVIKVYSVDGSYQPSLTTINVIGSQDIPPIEPPSLEAAVFSNDGSRFYIYFDQMTNQAGFTSTFMFACSTLFRFHGVSTSNCFWATANTVTVLSNDIIDLNSSIELLGGKVKSACPSHLTESICDEKFLPANSSVVYLSSPQDQPVVPVPAISLPSTISYCAELMIDPTSSYGRGNRPWLQVLWSVIGYSELNCEVHVEQCTRIASNVRELNKLLLSFNDTSSIYRIPSKFNIPSSFYEFSLILVNFLGYSSAISSKVYISKSSVTPVVTISGPPVISLYRWRSVSLIADVIIPGCAAPLKRPLQFMWKVYHGIDYLPEIVSISNNPRVFELPAYTLDAATAYTVQVIVNAGYEGNDNTTVTATSQATKTLNIGVSGVIAAFTTENEIITSSKRSVFLDASPSHDVDYPTDFASLTFQWSCMEVSPNFGAACSRFIYVSKAFRNLTIAPNVLIATQSGVTERIVNISIVVINSRGANAAVWILLTAIKSDLPVLQIEQNSVKYNPAAKIIINGTVIAVDPALSSWRAASLNDTFFTSSLLSPSIVPVSSGINLHQLVVKPNSLLPGMKYTFVLLSTYISFNSTYVSSSSITVVTNSPPSGGIFQVNPKRGIALNTSFFLITSSWVDDIDDFPLSFTMTYYVLTVSNQVIVKSYSPVPYVRTLLAQGIKEQDYEIYAAVTAIDNYGGNAVITESVIVEPMQVSIKDFADTLGSLSSYADKLGNPELKFLVISAVSVATSYADCSSAPRCSMVILFTTFISFHLEYLTLNLFYIPCSSVAKSALRQQTHAGNAYQGWLGPLGPLIQIVTPLKIFKEVIQI